MRGHRRLASSLAALGLLLLLPSVAAAETLVDWGDPGFRYLEPPAPTTGAAFAQPAFDDSGWAPGAAPFGFLTDCASSLPPVKTQWEGPELLARQRFTARPGTGAGRVYLRIDNDAEVYLNGELLGAVEHEYCANVNPPEAILADAILGGENVLAVRARDRGGQSYLDVRVEVEFIDTDGDGIGDPADNCPTVPNENQANADGDEFGNACDTETDDCVAGSCDASVATASTATSVTATTVDSQPGWLYLAVNIDDEPLDCANSTEFSPDIFTLDGSANISEKAVRLKFSWRTLFNGWQSSGISRVQFCFSAPYDFKVRPGYGKGTYLYDGDGDTVDEIWTKGVLPECRTIFGVTSVPPCVSRRTLLRDGIELSARVPGGGADPRYH